MSVPLRFFLLIYSFLAVSLSYSLYLSLCVSIRLSLLLFSVPFSSTLSFLLCLLSPFSISLALCLASTFASLRLHACPPFPSHEPAIHPSIPSSTFAPHPYPTTANQPSPHFPNAMPSDDISTHVSIGVRETCRCASADRCGRLVSQSAMGGGRERHQAKRSGQQPQLHHVLSTCAFTLTESTLTCQISPTTLDQVKGVGTDDF